MGLWIIAPLLILHEWDSGRKNIYIIFKLSKDYLNQKGIDVLFNKKLKKNVLRKFKKRLFLR
jgi:hypothetical protein